MTPPPPLAAALLIAAATAVHLAYAAAGPLGLAPDEAHYWDWSRRPDWAYYSKGPLVAWLIRVSCELFEPTAFAVRFPAVLCHALLSWAAYRLVREALDSPGWAVAAVALLETVPAAAAGAVLMTIDAPFLAAWAWAAVFARRAMFDGCGWTAAAACVALGTLAKYSMLLFPPCLALAAIALRRGSTAGVLTVALGGVVGLIPIAAWNAANDFVGVRHVFAQSGGESATIRWSGPAEFLAGQAGVLAGYWFAVGVAALWAFRPTVERGPNLRYLWWLTAPPAAAFLIASLRAKVQPNWPAPAFVGGFVLAVAWLRGQLAANRRRTTVCLTAGVTACLAVIVAAHFPQQLAPLLVSVAGSPTDAAPFPIRKLDPTARLRGWQFLAAEVDRVRDRVTAEDGQEPVVATMVWPAAGELAFYCRGNPQVFPLGAALTDRQSQYDVWRPNPVADAQAFRGRTFVYVGEAADAVQRAFASVESPVRPVYRENGVPVAGWAVQVCRGFRGFPARPPARH